MAATITIQDFRPYLTTGHLNELSDTTKYPAVQIDTIIGAVIAEYKQYVPCFDAEDETVFAKLKAVSLPHLGIILSYQTLNLVPAEQTEGKSRIERMYSELKSSLLGEMGGANGTICSILSDSSETTEICFIQTGTLNAIGVKNGCRYF